MDTIGNRLNLVRRNWGMTLEEFGHELGYGKAKTAARQVMSDAEGSLSADVREP